ncbi:NBR1-Ig-like domain-containing protein [Spirillospora sp. NPDC052269]
MPAQPPGVPATAVAPLHNLPGGPAPHLLAGHGGDIQPVTLPPRKTRGRKTLVTYVSAAVILAAGAGALVYAVFDSSGHSKSHKSAPKATDNASAAAAAVGCPVKPTQPAWAPPLHKGDAAAFVDDITLRDCTRVGPDMTVVKVWRIRNTGALNWRGYSLRRLELPQKPTDCRTKNRVPINTTRAGDTVDIRVEITTPKKAGFCIARFKMLDSAGRVAFSGNRPVNFQLVVHDG